MKQLNGAALRAAFPHTIPVLTGYFFLGATYGILLSTRGLGPFWAFFTSLFVLAGSMQYLSLALLALPFDPIAIFVLTLTVNARHLFYGVSMLKPFEALGKCRPYLIFALTDETFSLFCSVKEPEGVDRERFLFWIALLDHSYWVISATIGAAIGSVLRFNTAGFDFILTALFVVIVLDQWKARSHRIPALVGFLCSIAALIFFGAEQFLIPAMGMILISLLLLREPMQQQLQGGESS